MQLLVFAHRGEAQEFIRHYSFRPKDGLNYLYEAQDKLLMITGEGIYEVFSKLGLVLGKYPVEKVVNLGIAGGLDPKVKTGDFISIRTAYCHSDEIQFQSFTLSDPNAKLDAVTSGQRVLDDEYAQRLSCFAPIVDRELWAVAKTCSAANIPLFGHKLISDKAGSQTACFDLKQRALEFSAALLEGYLEVENSQEAPREEAGLTYPLPMSFTQKARYRKILKALKLSDAFDGELFRQRASELLHHEKLAPKQKANALLEEMELALNPLKKKTKERFEKLSAPVKEIGGNILFDKNFEKKKFTLQMEINGQKNLENLRERLASLRFEDFERVWDGGQDV